MFVNKCGVICIRVKNENKKENLIYDVPIQLEK